MPNTIQSQENTQYAVKLLEAMPDTGEYCIELIKECPEACEGVALIHVDGALPYSTKAPSFGVETRSPEMTVEMALSLVVSAINKAGTKDGTIASSFENEEGDVIDLYCNPVAATEMFTLIYTLFASDSEQSVHESIVGPLTFSTLDETVDTLLGAVEEEITSDEGLVDELISRAVDSGFGPVFDFEVADASTSEVYTSFLEMLNVTQKEEVVGWFFEIYSSENPEAFFRIGKHHTSNLKQELS
ncbi:hypothetical protein [Neptuniibacter sp. QD37_11]|uniref:hypothetical protein n=1 Tax=Neptuniibacter sp. QD37_11 TaxID=3398209 RepID=UPI0039F5BD0E